MKIDEKIEKYLVSEVFNTKTDIKVVSNTSDFVAYMFVVEGKKLLFTATLVKDWPRSQTSIQNNFLANVDVDMWYIAFGVSDENRDKFMNADVSPFKVVAGFKQCTDKFIATKKPDIIDIEFDPKNKYDWYDLAIKEFQKDHNEFTGMQKYKFGGNTSYSFYHKNWLRKYDTEGNDISKFKAFWRTIGSTNDNGKGVWVTFKELSARLK